MGVIITKRTNDEVTIEITVKLSDSMLFTEEQIQDKLNKAGVLVTEEALRRFDTNGESIIHNNLKYTVRTRSPKIYQSPYGEATVERNVYQTNKGGKVFVPLEESARIVKTATPRFAKIVSSKYATMSSTELVKDLEISNNRYIVRSYVKSLGDLVGSIVVSKEESWNYSIPLSNTPISTISIGIDGAMVRMAEDGFREAMVGSISFYNSEGKRMYSIYRGAAPEYGKETFYNQMKTEIEKVKKYYPHANYIGLADGARSNWLFLDQHTDHQLIDFYHSSEYVHKAADDIFNRKPLLGKKESWLKDTLHDLKHTKDAALNIIEDLKTQQTYNSRLLESDGINSLVSYFTNNSERMHFNEFVEKGWPIGSGVTEAACKTIVKSRMCNSGMKWKSEGAQMVLSLRCLVKSDTQWEQFWDKINQYGYKVAMAA